MFVVSGRCYVVVIPVVVCFERQKVPTNGWFSQGSKIGWILFSFSLVTVETVLVTVEAV